MTDLALLFWALGLRFLDLELTLGVIERGRHE